MMSCTLSYDGTALRVVPDVGGAAPAPGCSKSANFPRRGAGVFCESFRCLTRGMVKWLPLGLGSTSP